MDWEGKMPIQGKAAIRIEGGGRKSGYPDGAKIKERRGRRATGTWLVGERGEVIRIEGFGRTGGYPDRGFSQPVEKMIVKRR